jgi:hypothetical protein
MFAPARELKCRNTRVVSHVRVTPYVVNRIRENVQGSAHIFIKLSAFNKYKNYDQWKKAEVFCEHSVKCLCYWFLNSDNLM